MNTPTKIGSFVAALALVGAASYGIGQAVGPVGQDVATHDDDHAVHDDTGSDRTPTTTPAGAPTDVAGLAVSEAGYSLHLTTPILPAGTTPVALQVIGPDGAPVTEVDETHEEDLHLIAVRRDTTGFQHVHPTVDADGTWHADLELTPGAWRLFADLQPTALGHGITLGIDASVPGPYDPEPRPGETRAAEVDGYTVGLDGDLIAGETSEITLHVSEGGRPVTDLQPHLGAAGHLVALRSGDLAYLHVHPDGDATTTGPDITFTVTVPSEGWYRLYLDFRHDDVVRTVDLTLPAGLSPTTDHATPGGATTTTHPADDGHDHGH